MVFRWLSYAAHHVVVAARLTSATTTSSKGRCHEVGFAFFVNSVRCQTCLKGVQAEERRIRGLAKSQTRQSPT